MKLKRLPLRPSQKIKTLRLPLQIVALEYGETSCKASDLANSKYNLDAAKSQ